MFFPLRTACANVRWAGRRSALVTFCVSKDDLTLAEAFDGRHGFGALTIEGEEFVALLVAHDLTAMMGFIASEHERVGVPSLGGNVETAQGHEEFRFTRERRFRNRFLMLRGG